MSETVQDAYFREETLGAEDAERERAVVEFERLVEEIETVIERDDEALKRRLYDLPNATILPALDVAFAQTDLPLFAVLDFALEWPDHAPLRLPGLAMCAMRQVLAGNVRAGKEVIQVLARVASPECCSVLMNIDEKIPNEFPLVGPAHAMSVGTRAAMARAWSMMLSKYRVSTKHVYPRTLDTRCQDDAPDVSLVFNRDLVASAPGRCPAHAVRAMDQRQFNIFFMQLLCIYPEAQQRTLREAIRRPDFDTSLSNRLPCTYDCIFFLKRARDVERKELPEDTPFPRLVVRSLEPPPHPVAASSAGPQAASSTVPPFPSPSLSRTTSGVSSDLPPAILAELNAQNDFSELTRGDVVRDPHPFGFLRRHTLYQDSMQPHFTISDLFFNNIRERVEPVTFSLDDDEEHDELPGPLRRAQIQEGLQVFPTPCRYGFEFLDDPRECECEVCGEKKEKPMWECGHPLCAVCAQKILDSKPFKNPPPCPICNAPLIALKVSKHARVKLVMN